MQAPEPPNFREATASEVCPTCKMFDRGLCWGYGNFRVRPDTVCDAWYPDPRMSTVIRGLRK